MPARTLKQGGHRARVPAHMHASAWRGGRETLQVTTASTSKFIKYVISAKAAHQQCEVLQQV